jgi:hypothetical protein
MSELPAHVALLAPVPLQHLHSGVATCQQEGKVAFGSNAFDALHKLTEDAQGAPCDVFFYASDACTPGPPKVTWKGRYLRWVHAKAGRYPNGEKYRPATTESDTKWALFWEVSDLRELPAPEHIPVGNLEAIGKSSKLPPHFVPIGPLVVKAL